MSASQSAQIRQNVSEAAIRVVPWADGMVAYFRRPGATIEIYGWAWGEEIRGNRVWYNTGDGWVWSGAVTEIDYLPLVQFPNPPRHDPNRTYEVQRKRKAMEDGIFGSQTKAVVRGVAPKPRPIFSNIDVSSPEETDRFDDRFPHTWHCQCPGCAGKRDRFDDLLSDMEGTNALMLVDIERERQARMSYGIAPAPLVGWVAHLVLVDGKKKRYWRPTRRWADYIGRYVLKRAVRRRQRLWASQNPELVSALKLRIIEPTEAEERAAEISEWDRAFTKAVSENKRGTQ